MKSIRTLCVFLVSSLVLSLMLTACGLKGDLYLPQDKPSDASSQEKANSNLVVDNKVVEPKKELQSQK